MSGADSGRISAPALAAWWVQEEQFNRVCCFLQDSYGDYTLRERQNLRIRVEVSALDGGGDRRLLSAMFGTMESRKEELCVQEYSIGQTSLEQIFNQFAARQEEETGPAGGGAGL